MPDFSPAAFSVRLVNAFARPYDNAVATARTCYSSKGIITAEQVAGDHLEDEEKKQRARERRDALARDIFEAGHHTTLQHAHFQFAISGVSRQFLWTFLHAHPFYNSEQVSQRYVEVAGDSFYFPPGLAPRARGIYQEALRDAYAVYLDLTERLVPTAARLYYEVFPGRRHKQEIYGREVRKKAQEIGRYALPVATTAYLYHTVSGLTLLRYHRLCRELDAPDEQRSVVQAMVDQVLEVDGGYRNLLTEPIPLESTPEYQFFLTLMEGPGAAERGRDLRRYLDTFDASLAGKTSMLIDWKQRNEEVLAEAVREVYGVTPAVLDDDEAIALALDPARNPHLGEAMNVTTMAKVTRALVHAGYTFRKKLSHTADSQDQRHRMTPASRPCLPRQVTDRPDYIVPELLKHDAEAVDRYRRAMERAWVAIGRLREAGASAEDAAYLLPNATAVRFTESADLQSLHHKLAMRLCYNAQEEIWRASLDEALQVRDINPRIGTHLLPPCGIRKAARTTPFCPEGKRYCGVPVWNLDPSEYQRVL